MKQGISIFVVLALVMVFQLIGVADALAAEPALEGTWLGKLAVSGVELRIVFNVARDADGTYTATLDSPDQGAKGIPVSKVQVENGTVLFEIKAAAALYEGKFNADASEITGQWKQGGVALPLDLKRVAEVVLNRPQTPQKPYPYREVEVTYMNEKDQVRLAGTLTLPDPADPNVKSPYPVAILITGSGAQDRDETMFEHKPFLVIADALTRRGIAVLRVDDRGVGGSTGDPETATSQDLANDVKAGIAFLKTRSDIDPERIGLIGHSEGGMIAPMVAVDLPEDVAFIVLLAGPGVPGDEIMVAQGELINRAYGASEEDIQTGTVFYKRLCDVIKGEQDLTAARQKLHLIFDDMVKTMTEEEKDALGDIDQYIAGQIEHLTSPWFRYFLSYDPRPALRQVKCPVLAINGTKDLQVPYKENLEAIRAALTEAGNTAFTLRELPNLNHLFQTTQTGSPAEYGVIEETIAADALRLITDWVYEHTSSVR